MALARRTHPHRHHPQHRLTIGTGRAQKQGEAILIADAPPFWFLLQGRPIRPLQPRFPVALQALALGRRQFGRRRALGKRWRRGRTGRRLEAFLRRGEALLAHLIHEGLDQRHGMLAANTDRAIAEGKEPFLEPPWVKVNPGHVGLLAATGNAPEDSQHVTADLQVEPIMHTPLVGIAQPTR